MRSASAPGAEDPLSELEFTTENSQDVTRALPTMPVVLGFGGGGVIARIGTFNPVMLVRRGGGHAGREVPPEGELEAVTEIVGIYDKGSGAVDRDRTSANLSVRRPAAVHHPDRDLPAGRRRLGRRARGPSSKFEAPEQDPDHEVTYQTHTDQALLYRLSGDRSRCTPTPSSRPWPASPDRSSTGCAPTGSRAGPCCTRWPAATPRFRSMSGRFSSPVFPGEALTVRVWVTGDGEAAFQTSGPDGRIVLDAGRVTFALILGSSQNSRGSPESRPRNVVVDLDAGDGAAAGRDPGLRLDLGHEHAPHRARPRVPLQELQVAGQLLDPVDLAPALDLDGHRPSRVGTAGDGADAGQVLPANQRQPEGDGVAVRRQQLLGAPPRRPSAVRGRRPARGGRPTRPRAA